MRSSEPQKVLGAAWVRRAAWILLVLVGGLWGYFAYWTHVGTVHGSYPLEWTVDLGNGDRTPPARWIRPAGEPLIGYYRKVVRAPGTIQSAWIQVTAPFTFTLYVNDKPVGGAFYKSARASGLFDITRYVVPGPNTLAITNTSRTYGETSRVAVLGGIVDWQGHVTPIRSDASWKALNRYARQIERAGKPEWFQIRFDHSSWPDAVAADPPAPDDIAREQFPPRALTRAVPTGWVWSDDPTAEEVFFRYSFRARGRPQDGWLRIAARHSYALFVNGYPLGTEEGGVVDNPAMTSLDVYDITPYLGRGGNTIAVKVRRGALDHGLVVDGYWQDRTGTHDIETRDGNWKASEAFYSGWEDEGFDDEAWDGASALRTDSPAMAVSFIKRQKEIEEPRGFLMVTLAGLLWLELLGAAIFLAVAYACVRLSREDPRGRAWAAPALASLLPALLISFVWLLGYDYRLDPSFSFRPVWIWSSLLIFLVSCAWITWSRRFHRSPVSEPAGELDLDAALDAALPGAVPSSGPTHESGTAGTFWRYRHVIVLALVLIAGCAIRVENLAYEPIGADEIKMLEKSKGIMILGLPHVIVAEELGVRLAVTSELVHYPMAWSILIFGENELALRMPGVLFSLFTVILLYRFGQVLHSRGAGLLAATLFSLLPSVIRMSQLARYPSQLAFFTLLTAYLWWRCITRESIANRYLFYMTGCYLLTYLTWEGSGFLIPSLFLALVLARPRDLRSTLSHPALVGCLFVTGLVILLQLNIRAIVAGDLFIYGTGTSELTLVPTWNHSNFDTMFYWHNFFLIENHQVMAWLFLAGIPLAFQGAWWARGLRFLYGMTFMNLFMKTCFLQIRNWRYTYNLIPFLCLVSAVVLFVLAGYAMRLARESGALRRQSRRIGEVVLAGGVIIVLFSSTAFLFKLYELPGSHGLPRTRLEDRYYPTIHEAVQFMDQHLEDDDIIITPVPHLVDFYIRDADYFLETILHFQVFLNPARNTTMHRVSGTQAILTYDDLQKVLAKNRRVWIVTSPLDEKLLDDETQEWITENMEVVYENIASLVYLAEN